jgi:putative peptidoglycan lipid II flippase
MMWAPALNNLVAIAVLATYLGAFGASASRCSGYTGGQEILHGLVTTAGVAIQCLALVPYLRRAGVRFRVTPRLLSPRMRTTLRLGGWTVAVVLTNQVVYAVVVRLATSGTAPTGGCLGDAHASGTGYTIYSSAYLLIMAPHAIVTVSLMTASLPGLALLAAAGDRSEVARRLTSALRLVMTVIVPVSALVVLLAPVIADLVWGYGTGARSSRLFAPTLACFGVALVCFTAHYVALRGLYALEANRVILGIQVVVGAVDLTLAVLLVGLTGPAATAPALATAYAAAYALGAVVSWSVLGKLLGRGEYRSTLLALCRIAAGTAIGSLGCLTTIRAATGHRAVQPGSKGAALLVAATGTAVFVGLFLASARALRVPEVRTLGAALRRR